MKQSYQMTNVSATFAGNKIYWEILPRGAAEGNSSSSFLEGSVFIDAAGKPLPPCFIVRKDGYPVSSLEIVGSVCVGMKDIDLTHIDFVDENGVDVKPQQVTQSKGLLGDIMDAIEFKKVAKERIMKQIIRKHLVEQGLKAEGSVVEICRAST